MVKLTYCKEKQDYFVDDWLVAAVLGTKALLQKKDGKKMLVATLEGGRTTEQKIGAKVTLGTSKLVASSRGWVFDD
jgi:hypothetical protein